MANYKKETDYQALIEQAAAAGDYQAAARLEAQRNEKIRQEGLDYGQTSNYAGWLDNNDYGKQIRTAIAGGSSKDEVADLLGKRMEKASSTAGMSQWVKDDIYDEAMAYLTAQTGLPQYESSYSGQISALLDKLLAREAFSYDYESDPLYQAYAGVYRQEGRRAAADALGQAAQNTGGYASSYAAAAAQQAGSVYSARQAGVIPELYKLAYTVYLDEGEAQMSQLEQLRGMEQQEYQRYRDQVEDLQKQAALDYEKYSDLLARARADEQQAYERSRDALADQRYETEWQYGLARDALADARYAAAQAVRSTNTGRSAAVSVRPAEETPEAAKTDDAGDVRVYGLPGTYTQAEADAMVLSGLARRVRSGGQWIYQLAAVE